MQLSYYRAVLEWDNLRTLFLAFILLAELCASNCALPLNRPADMVDTDSFSDIAEHRYIRDDSLADLLLKNLRFRSVEKRAYNPESVVFLDKILQLQDDKNDKLGGLYDLHAARKRHGLSVAELAAMLSQLKSRGAATDDGVKLQSLRFGGYE